MLEFCKYRKGSLWGSWIPNPFAIFAICECLFQAYIKAVDLSSFDAIAHIGNDNIFMTHWSNSQKRSLLTLGLNGQEPMSSLIPFVSCICVYTCVCRGALTCVGVCVEAKDWHRNVFLNHSPFIYLFILETLNLELNVLPGLASQWVSRIFISLSL